MGRKSGVVLGDALSVLRRIPDKSVHCCVTSPPYWGLRDYGVDGQIGLEETPEAYTARMVDVFREVRRVLRDDGTVWLNLGDSYSGGGHGGHIDHKAAKGVRGRSVNNVGGLKPKDLVGIPWRIAFALQSDGWYLRQDIIWHKPNPMPESVTDRCTKAHEYIFLLTKSARYWYDAEAIREESKPHILERKDGMMSAYKCNKQRISNPETVSKFYDELKGANKRSVWTVTTKPFSGAHFAVFPEELIKPCVLAGCPEKVCPKCGAGWVRIIEKPELPEVEASDLDRYGTGKSGVHRKVRQAHQNWRDAHPDKTVGWEPSCGCGAEGTEHGIVLDPFAGAATTGVVAKKLNRVFVGIELNPEYRRMCMKRLAETPEGVGYPEEKKVPEEASFLLTVPGVGGVTAFSIWEHFGDHHSLITASVDDLCGVSGVGPKTAEVLYKSFRKCDEERTDG